MRGLRLLLSLVVMLGTAWSQDDTALSETRERFLLASAKAIANFRSAESVADNLEQRGSRLHPEFAVLRSGIERALDQTEAALEKKDVKSANRTLARAEGLIARYAKKLGGK